MRGEKSNVKKRRKREIVKVGREKWDKGKERD